ncbi:MAG TPA: glycine--tRNA ligase subunit beta [Casimicrobiaceae bacterium]|nr:glycine--tRNA ligase subunit beta [Casimicrobiaceae bacterium]
MTATAATLTVELLTEELPPKALRRLGEAFAGTLAAGLKARGFLTQASTATPYATPRRLAVSIAAVLAKAPDAQVRTKLMPAKVALADGQATPAFRKKLESLGRAQLAGRGVPAEAGPDRLYVESDGKADYVWLESLAQGQPLARGLQEALDEAIGKLPIPKVMRYARPGSYYNDIAFVRPAHRLLALHGPDVVPVTALGLAADRLTDGHRFLARTGIAVATADAYAEALLAEGKVVPGFDERRAAIEAQLAKAAQGDRVVAPDALLDEVTSLVEWPVAYAGTFDPAFLAVPQECLILTMQQNQKYFALTDATGTMRARFLVVSNLETRDASRIVGGNERVLRARLADAKFFFEQDRKAALATRLPKLDSVVYLAKLGPHGSQGHRVGRLARLAREIAPAVGADPALAERAARLAKADLVTDMVGEFPELQGTMGRYYAQHDGEHAEVADAVAQHYWPRFAGDALPERPVAQAAALADKMEAMAGLFGVGQVPTGDKDPFGLRRAAIGVLRILVEKRIDLPLPTLIALAFAAFDGVAGFRPAPAELATFLEDRLRGWLREQGATAHQTEALLAVPDVPLPSLPARLAALQAFESLPEAAALAAANKRIVNILRKSGAEAAAAVDRALLGDGAERDLWLAFQRLDPDVQRHMDDGDYASALRALATTKPVVDRFFDDVMVMADDPGVRANRLALLSGVAQTMNRVAEIGRLAA